MNTLDQLTETLLPALELAGIVEGEYLIIGSAAEFIGGYVDKFGDVDILVSKETFQRLIDDNFEWYYSETVDPKVKIIRIGFLDIISHEGDWLEKEKDSTHAYPILSPNNLIEWRLFAGRPKDQLRAWQLIHKFYAMLRQYLEPDPLPNKLLEIKTIEQNMFDYQTCLMEMR